MNIYLSRDGFWSSHTFDSRLKYGKRNFYFPKTIPYRLELVVEEFKDNGFNYQIL